MKLKGIEDVYKRQFFEYAKTAEEKGFKVIIAGAGMAAHLPGMCAAIFPIPVIGIPTVSYTHLMFPARMSRKAELPSVRIRKLLKRSQKK